ncbi:MAG: metallo-beta-lactamase family protein [Pseudomonadota bacterium]|nr:metallo-beta-lactamase family protein [Pseudomonadota bacterium]
MKIQFLGATEYVTGSCHLLTLGRYSVLLDCGLIQGGFDDDEKNHQTFAFDPATIDAVILSHAHLDHSGRLPLLVKQGFTGPVYTHHASVELCQVMLEDSGYLNERSVEWENKKRERRGQPLLEPLYTQDDAKQALNNFNGIEYAKPLQIFPGITVTLFDAGHILGSAIVQLDLAEHGEQRTVVFSGDLGHSGAPILKNPVTLHHANLVMMESTYGNRLHRSWDETWQELGEIFQTARNDKGNILIPAFTVGRTQEILYMFGQHFEEWGLADWQIFLDSPMAIETNRIYSKYSHIYNHLALRRYKNCGNPFDLPNLHLTESTEASMNVNKIASGAIVIAGSGMCTGGRIKHHLKHNLWRKHSHIVFVGFQARGTLGRALVDGAKQVTLWGETINVNATVHTIGGLSAHADQDGLCNWYQHFNNRPLVKLVHGEADAQKVLIQKLKNDFNAPVSAAREGETLDLLKL